MDSSAAKLSRKSEAARRGLVQHGTTWLLILIACGCRQGQLKEEVSAWNKLSPKSAQQASSVPQGQAQAFAAPSANGRATTKWPTQTDMLSPPTAPIFQAPAQAPFPEVSPEFHFASTSTPTSPAQSSVEIISTDELRNTHPVALPIGAPTQPTIDVVSDSQLPMEQIEIPLEISSLPTGQISAVGSLITLSVRDTTLHAVLNMIAQQQGLSIVAPADLQTAVTISLQPMPLDQALDAITAICNCTWHRVHNVIYVTPVESTSNSSYQTQGRMIQVFDLDYLMATDVEQVVTGLLSPVGKVFTRQADPKNKRKAVEQVVVEDLPAYVERIAGYIAEVDHAPNQVMVEVRLLQVKLEKDDRHGINFDAIAELSGTQLSMDTQSLAGVGTNPVFTIDGGDFDGFLDCLVSTNDAKTLAAPKLLMVNEQESKIQIGRRLGYFVTTTTQTSTLQDVQFLEVGVVLTVTPQITRDGRILMKVHPKVSSGEINPTTTLPEEETTEVDTSVMVPSGNGVVIGGLIQEADIERQSKLPILGDLWLIGRLFQRRTVERERVEVVVALLPQIVDNNLACMSEQDAVDLQRTHLPILTPSLESAPRPEPSLNDAIRNPTWPARR